MTIHITAADLAEYDQAMASISRQLDMAVQAWRDCRVVDEVNEVPEPVSMVSMATYWRDQGDPEEVANLFAVAIYRLAQRDA